MQDTEGAFAKHACTSPPAPVPEGCAVTQYVVVADWPTLSLDGFQETITCPGLRPTRAVAEAGVGGASWSVISRSVHWDAGPGPPSPIACTVNVKDPVIPLMTQLVAVAAAAQVGPGIPWDAAVARKPVTG